MPKFRKKPIVIEAIRWDGQNDEQIRKLGDREGGPVDGGKYIIFTLEGAMTANHGDWIIRGVAGELYPCRDDIFAATYEQVNESDPTDAGGKR